MYHITTRGNAGQDIFLGDEDRRMLLAFLAQKETHLLEVARYIVLNPVRAGLTRSPHDSEWSGYRPTARQSTCPESLTVDWILSRCDTDPTRAARA